MHILHYYMMLQYLDDFLAVLSLELLRLLNNTQVAFYDLLICHMHNLHYYIMLQYQDNFLAVLFLGLLRLLNSTQVPFYTPLMHHMQDPYHYMMLQYQDDFQVTPFFGFSILSYNNKVIQDNMLNRPKEKLYLKHTLPKFHPHFLAKRLHY